MQSIQAWRSQLDVQLEEDSEDDEDESEGYASDEIPPDDFDEDDESASASRSASRSPPPRMPPAQRPAAAPPPRTRSDTVEFSEDDDDSEGFASDEEPVPHVTSKLHATKLAAPSPAAGGKQPDTPGRKAYADTTAPTGLASTGASQTGEQWTRPPRSASPTAEVI